MFEMTCQLACTDKRNIKCAADTRPAKQAFKVHGLAKRLPKAVVHTTTAHVLPECMHSRKHHTPSHEQKGVRACTEALASQVQEMQKKLTIKESEVRGKKTAAYGVVNSFRGLAER